MSGMCQLLAAARWYDACFTASRQSPRLRAFAPSPAARAVRRQSEAFFFAKKKQKTFSVLSRAKWVKPASGSILIWSE